jgi:hypothetical protein
MRDAVEVAFVGRGYSGNQLAKEAAVHGVHLAVVTLPAAKHGLVLLPRRRVVERCLAGAARFRRLARDRERLPITLAGCHCSVFAVLMLRRVAELAVDAACQALDHPESSPETWKR